MIVSITAGFPRLFAPALWRWLNSPRSPNFDDFGARDFEAFCADLAERVKNQRVWSIRIDGTVVGYLGFAPQSPIAGQFQGLVIAPGQRAKGIGRRAVMLVMQELQREGFRKLFTTTFADNEPIRRLFLALGFEEQGYLTAATERDGQPMDLRLLAYPGAQNTSRV